MTEEDRQYQREWHLDKKVPIAMIMAILLQTGTFFWFASRLDHRVEVLERSESRAIVTAPAQADRITRLEVRVENVQEIVTEIKRLIQSKP